MSEHDVEEPSWGRHIREWVVHRIPGARVDLAIFVMER